MLQLALELWADGRHLHLLALFAELLVPAAQLVDLIILERYGLDQGFVGLGLTHVEVVQLAEGVLLWLVLHII